MNLFYKKMKSPIGPLYLVSTEKNLTNILFQEYWADFKKEQSSLVESTTTILKKTEAQLEEYFAGKRKKFDLTTELEGTDFQLKTWQALLQVPYGETVSYQDQAKLLKKPKAVRAVGGANRVNPICIIYPCHRVIGKSGSLTGYAGGLEKKKFLLKLEGHKV